MAIRYARLSPLLLCYATLAPLTWLAFDFRRCRALPPLRCRFSPCRADVTPLLDMLCRAMFERKDAATRLCYASIFVHALRRYAICVATLAATPCCHADTLLVVTLPYMLMLFATLIDVSAHAFHDIRHAASIRRFFYDCCCHMPCRCHAAFTPCVDFMR